MKILEDMVKKNGDLQVTVAMEECAELIQALSKHLRGKADYDNISEEMADVYIMLEQMKILFKNEVDVEVWKAYKINRMEEGMSDEM